VLHGRFVAVLPASGAAVKFNGWKKRWGAKLLASGETSAVFQVGKKGSSWLPWRNRAALHVEVRWTRPLVLVRKVPEVSVRIRPARPGSTPDLALLKELGPELLEALQIHLLGSPERRNGERLPWPHPVGVTVVAQGRGQTLECQGKDLSLAGMGLYLPSSLPASRVRLSLSSPSLAEPVTVSGSVVRIQRWDDNLFEAGVLFD
jgi:hypothetical protein